MSVSIRRVLGLAVLILVLQVAVPSRSSAADDPAAVRAWLQAAYQQVNDATGRRDLDGIFAYDAPTCQYEGLDGSRSGRADLMDLVRRSLAVPAAGSSTTRDVVSAVDLRGDTVVASIEGTITAQVANHRTGKVQTLQESYTSQDTWVRSATGWQRTLSHAVSASTRVLAAGQAPTSGFAPGRPGTGPGWPHTAQEAVGAARTCVTPLTRKFMEALNRGDHKAAYAMLSADARTACPVEKFVPFVQALEQAMGPFQDETLYDVSSYPSAITGNSAIIGTYAAKFARGPAVLQFSAETNGKQWNVLSFKYYAPASGQAPAQPWMPMVTDFLQKISQGADQDAFSRLVLSGAVGPAMKSFTDMATRMRQMMGAFKSLQVIYMGAPADGGRSGLPEGTERYLCEAQFERGPAILAFMIVPSLDGTWSIGGFNCFSPLFIQEEKTTR